MPEMPTDINNVTHLVQMALTPAFLLSGIGAVLAVLSARLSRVVDRSHQIEDQIKFSQDRTSHIQELKILDARCGTIHRSLFFCTISAFCICAVVSIIYVGKLYLDSEATGTIVSWLFALSMGALTISLFLLMKEIRICAQCIYSSTQN
jgi:hypothetical protein